MKFMALKDALEVALRVATITTPPPPATPPLFPAKPAQRVLRDGIARDPIDKTAALVTSKAPWWAQPLYGKTSKTDSNVSRQKIATNNIHNTRRTDKERAPLRAQSVAGELKPGSENTASAPADTALVETKPTLSSSDWEIIEGALMVALYYGVITSAEVEQVRGKR